MRTAPQLTAIDRPLLLRSGRSLPQYSVGYETYGTLAPERDNAILVCHTLTTTSRAAGLSPGSLKPGWWDAAIGPGKMLDTDRYFVICMDTLAAGRSTGPAGIDPATGRPYGLSFPVVEVADMVAAQTQLLDRLGIERLHLAIGGCFGGQQVLVWAIEHPQRVRNAVVITATPTSSAHTIAIFSVMRRLIRSDKDWNGGDYYGGPFPAMGLGNAIAAGVPLWMSREAMTARFDRRTERGGALSYTLDSEFAVEAFLDRLADNAPQVVDPNGLMYLTRAVEYFDLTRSYGSLAAAFANATARFLFVSYSNDWRYPAAETALMHDAIRDLGGSSEHKVLDSPLGHGGFLLDVDGLGAAVRRFMADEAAAAPARGHAMR